MAQGQGIRGKQPDRCTVGITQGDVRRRKRRSTPVVVAQAKTVEQMLAAARKRDERQAAYGRIIQGAMDRGMDTDEAERLVQAAVAADMDEVQFEFADSTRQSHQPGYSWSIDRPPRR